MSGRLLEKREPGRKLFSKRGAVGIITGILCAFLLSGCGEEETARDAAKSGQEADLEAGDMESNRTVNLEGGDTESGRTADSETGDAESGRGADSDAGDMKSGQPADSGAGKTEDGQSMDFGGAEVKGKAVDPDSVEETGRAADQPSEPEEREPERYDIVMTFAGDICLDDTCAVMQDYIGQGEKLENNVDPALLEKMREADLCVVNNEFAYSDRGEPLANKMYTFRADPKRVSMLQEMGVDVAGLANNHVYDYGPEAMEDTLKTLRRAGIDYVGAGWNLAEAMTPVYREIDGKKIAFVAASRAEKYKLTPQATEDAAGILRCYDTELFLEEIRQADETADYVIALVHWGTEYSTKLEEVQRTTGKDYIDAGADIVIGSHTHCLQGMEYYRGKPILYSLGNFWFNNKSLDSMLVQVKLSGESGAAEISADDVEVQIIPAKQENCRTRLLSGEDAQELFDELEGLSVGVEIDEAGVLMEKEQE